MGRLKILTKKLVAIFGALVIIVVILFVLSVTSRNNTNQNNIPPSPTESPEPTPGIAPDWASVDKAARNVAKDQNADHGSDGEKSFPSKSIARENTITYKDGNAAFVREIYTVQEGKKGAGIKKLIGEPEIKLYGPESDFGLYLYAYPTKGVAYIANEHTDTVTEVWYFPPTTISGLLSTWAKDYSKKFVQNNF